MPLDFPHNYSGNAHIAQSVSNQNLDKILTALNTGQKLSSQDVVTKEALECFQFIQSNRNGCGHRCKKYTAVVASWTAGTILPFSALALTGKYAFESFALPYGITEEARTAYYNEHPYQSAIIAGAVSLAAVEALARKGGFSVVRPMLNGVTTGYALLVNTLIKGVIRSYDADTAKKEEMNKDLHKDLVKGLENTYNGIADDLQHRFNAVRNTPKQLLEFQKEAAQLSNANGQFVQGLKKLNVNDAEIAQILNKFKSTTEAILNEKISLRSGTSDQDIAYNINLLTYFPITAELCIPAKAQQYIAAAKAHQLGSLHTVKQCVATTVSGVLSFAAVTAASFTSTFMCKEIPTPSNPYLCPTKITYIDSTTTCAPITALSESGFCKSASSPLDSMNASLKDFKFDLNTVLVGTLGLSISSLIASRVSSGYEKQRINSTHTITELNKLGTKEINSAYENIATYFNKKLNKAKNDVNKLNALKKETEQFVSQLENIFKEIRNCGIDGLSPEDCTEQLQIVLSEILTTEATDLHPAYSN